MDDWVEERTVRAGERYVRYLKVKTALAQLVGAAVVIAAVVVALTYSLLWGVVILFAGGFAVSLAALPLMLLLQLAMCGRDGMRAGVEIEKYRSAHGY